MTRRMDLRKLLGLGLALAILALAAGGGGQVKSAQQIQQTFCQYEPLYCYCPSPYICCVIRACLSTPQWCTDCMHLTECWPGIRCGDPVPYYEEVLNANESKDHHSNPSSAPGQASEWVLVSCPPRERAEFCAFPPEMDFSISMAVSPDRRLLAHILWEPATIRVLEARTGQIVQRLALPHPGRASLAAFSPDNRLLASGLGDGTVRLWELLGGQEVAVLKGHTEPVTGVAFSPDGRLLASGSWDQTVKVWDIASGREVRTMVGHTDKVGPVVFSPDGRFLASASADGTARLWDVATGEEVYVLRGHSKGVYTVAFAPSGDLLATGSWDTTVRLWDVHTGQELRVLKGHTALIREVAFSPDGRMVASGSSDGTIRLWDVGTGAEIHVLDLWEVLKLEEPHKTLVEIVEILPPWRIVICGVAFLDRELLVSMSTSLVIARLGTMIHLWHLGDLLRG